MTTAQLLLKYGWLKSDNRQIMTVTAVSLFAAMETVGVVVVKSL